MEILKAILLGVIQGITEFLPVSSSGHLELGKSLFNVVIEDNLAFNVAVHVATVLSTLVVFRHDIAELARGLIQRQGEAVTFTRNVVVSMLPLIPIYLFVKDPIDRLLDRSVTPEALINGVVGACLLVTGVLLLLTIRVTRHDQRINTGKAALIGIAQAVAVLPGISRSGSTIATGLLLGVDRTRMARFSFLMVIPPILAAAALDIKDMAASPASIDVGPLLGGFTAAFVTGLAACQWMIGLVKRGGIRWFAYYCFAVGVVAVILSVVA